MRRKKRKAGKKLFIILLLLLSCYIGIISIMPKQSVSLYVEEYNQHPDYPTGCESAALYMLLRYYDVDVSMEDIVDNLAKGPRPYTVNGVVYGANPEREFVGDPRNNDSFGVFNKPIRDVADIFKPGARTMENASFYDIERILSHGNPVIAWYTTNLEKGITFRIEWLDYKTGDLVRWPSAEHAVVITGYDKENFYYNDPSTGNSVTISKAFFQKDFEILGRRIVYYDE